MGEVGESLNDRWLWVKEEQELSDPWLGMKEGQGVSGLKEKSESQSLNSSLESRAMLGRLMASDRVGLPPGDDNPVGDVLMIVLESSCDEENGVTDRVLRIESRSNISDRCDA